MQTKMRRNDIKTSAYCILLTLLSLGPYLQTVTFDFVDFDDLLYIEYNAYVSSGLSMENILWAFRSFYASNWHPLTWISHMLDVQLFGLNPGWHHFVNALFHSINALLLFLALRQLTGFFWQSLAVAALFAVHPLHVESVAFIAERKDMLSTSFWMMTMLAYCCYSRQGGKGRYSLVVFLYAAGLMTKPMLVTLPFILLLIDYWPLERHSCCSTRFALRSFLWEKIPLFILSALSCWITITAQNRGDSLAPFTSVSILHNFQNALQAYVLYLWKMIWPVKLAAFYPMPDQFSWWLTLGSCLILIVVTVIAVRKRYEYPYLMFGWFWYLVTLLPVIGIVRVGNQAMADRYTYIPLVGIFIIVAYGISDISVRWPLRTWILPVISGVAITALATLTWIQVGYWKNGVTLFEHTLKVTTNNPIARHNLGVAMLNRRQNKVAIEHFRKALLLSPNFKQAYLNMGRAYTNLGESALAAQSYLNAIAVDPNYMEARYKLADSYIHSGRPDLANRVLFDYR